MRNPVKPFPARLQSSRTRLAVPALCVGMFALGGCGGSGSNTNASVIGSRSVTIVDLGTLADSAPAYATALNDAGQVVGYAVVPDTISAVRPNATKSAPFVWQNGKLTALDIPDDASAVPAAINNQGQIAGYTLPFLGSNFGAVGTGDSTGGLGSGATSNFPTPSDSVGQNGAFLYDKQGLHKLFAVTTYASQALAINDKAQVAGSVTDTFNLSNTPPRMFARQNSVNQVLMEPASYAACYATGINNKGVVVGYATSAASVYSGGLAFLNGGRTGRRERASTPSHSLINSEQAVVYAKGVYTVLPALGGEASRANAINDSGQIVGAADTAAGATHAALWQNGTVTDLGTLSGSSYASAISAGGDVVGTSYTGSLDTFGAVPVTFAGFIVHKGVMTNLNTLLPAASGWELWSATGINNRGEIVGYGKHNGQLRAFLLRP